MKRSMKKRLKTCPLTQKQIVETYFMENRVKVLDAAAFLDRMDRAREIDARGDFRYKAFKESLKILVCDIPNKVEEILKILSDPTTTPLEKLDTKSAFGAYNEKSK